MPRRGSWVWTAALLGALGCAGTEEGAAQEQPPASPEQPGKQPEAKPDKDKKAQDAAEALEKEEEGRSYDMEVSEKGTKFKLVLAALFVPEVSLFGGEGGQKSKLVRLKCGSAEITIPFRRIKRIDVKAEKEDRLEVTITVVAAEGQKEEEKKLEGTVKAGLELRGTYAGTDLPATAKLRDVIAVDLVPQKK